MKVILTSFAIFLCITICDAQNIFFENQHVRCKMEVKKNTDSITAKFTIINKLEEAIYIPDSLAESDIDLLNQGALSVNIGWNQSASINYTFFLKEIPARDSIK